MAYDLVTAERVRHLLAERHDVNERKMMGGLMFMVKGGMCCAVSGRGGLLVRTRVRSSASAWAAIRRSLGPDRPSYPIEVVDLRKLFGE
ncbi:MAG TPA: hypothetical protein VLL30_17770, partial [Reyranella sp.]|nr:hypothetical protein [Reyranella sp.]